MLRYLNSLSLVSSFYICYLLFALNAIQAANIPQQQQQQPLTALTNIINETLPITKINIVATSPLITSTTTRTTLPTGNTFIDITGNGNFVADQQQQQQQHQHLPPTAAASAAEATSVNGYLQQQQQPPQQQQHHLKTLDKEVVERLIKQWAPIVWLAPEEKFLPLGVEEFLNHVHPMDREHNFTPGMTFSEYSTKSYLVTNTDVEELLKNEESFLYGRNPNESRVPIYAVVTLCGNQPIQQAPQPPMPPTPKKQLPILTLPIPAAEDQVIETGTAPPVQLPPLSSTRGPYIPVSIDPMEEQSETIRRSSRLYPVFQRVRRDLTPPATGTATTAPALNELEYMPFSAYDLATAESSNNIADSSGGSTFIANLADNVKFSVDEIEDNTINAQRFDVMGEKQKVPGFHVTYWMFYPYSQGKTMCTLSLGPLGRIPFPAVYGYCLGRRKDIGSHIGDWEHMSLYFNGDAEPEAMYVSAHDAGAYYSYNRLTGSFEFKRQETRKGILQRPNFPKTVTTFNDHPVLFAAKGSHGLWTAPGKHRFVKVARLYDINGFGTPWNTWKAVDISYENLKSFGRSLVPDWLTFKGKWGNPKNKCHPFRRIGLNFCEFTDGPTGIPLKESHFECGATYR